MVMNGGGAAALGARIEGTRERVLSVEERYRALVRNFPKSAIVLFDHDLRFVLVDGPEVNASGYSKELMEGRTLWEALPAEFAKVVEVNMRRVLAGEEFTAELPFDGRMYRYEYVPVRDDAGAVLYGLIVATNVTERHTMESQLRRSEERFAKIFHVMPNPFAVTRAADGVLIEVNAAFVELLGWSREEVIGKSTVELGMWPDPTRRADVLEMLQDRPKVENLDMPVRCKDGRVLHGVVSFSSLELDGTACIFFAYQDQTEKLRTLRALELSEARLRGLADATFEGIAITQGGKILDVNDQLAAMYGQHREDLLGHGVIDLVAPESAELVRGKMSARDDHPYEHLALRADGTRFPVEVRGRHAVIQGTPVRVTAIRDVTQRKKDEAERDRLIAELSARNAEMEEFAHTVSHDLKSPLVTISGFLGALERDIAEGDRSRIQGDMARIHSAASKMMRLLNDLLELSRVGRVTEPKEDVALADVVAEVLELLSGSIAARGARVVVDRPLPVVRGSRLRLLQVVQNLVENALKYMGNEKQPLIEIGERPDPTGRVCFVRDNGIGIKPMHAERVFGIFEKLDPKSEGTGLGLALVRRIIEYHGGRVSVESDGAHGSTFVLWFPRDSSPAREREVT